MEKGKVKWFDPKKGYGFIEPEDWSNDVFVHINDVEKMGLKNLTGNQRIGYDIETKDNKPNAVNLKLIKTEE